MDLWLAIAAGLFFGVYQLFNRKAGQSLGVVPGMSVLLTTCVVVASIIVVSTIRPVTSIVFTWKAVVLFALAGVFHFVLGIGFLSMSQHRVGATRTGALVGSTPLFATAVGFVALGEVLSLWTIAGIVLMVMGVAVVSLD